MMRISKKILVQKVAAQLELKEQDVDDVINGLIGELIADLRAGKQIIIANFCKMSLQKSKPRKYHDIKEGKILSSKGKNLLKLKIPKKLRKLIRSKLDIYKTFL